MQPENTQEKSEPTNFYRLVSGSFMIAGTAVGAGMLGIPLVTGSAGFVPACLITVIVWVFMLCTGLLFLEASLWMPSGSNVLSITKALLGRKAEFVSGIVFLCLYYCLVIAYIAAGAPFMRKFLFQSVGVAIAPTASYWIFGLGVAAVIAAGARWINRANIMLSIAMVVAFVFMMETGTDHISSDLLQAQNYGMMAFAVPVLFGAFGYHNVIPSLVTYLERDKRALRASIIIGSTIALLSYLLWQYLVIGTVSLESIEWALRSGKTATHALKEVSVNPLLFVFARYFSIFALVTSLLGVSFSMVDFYADGFNQFNIRLSRVWICALIFIPSIGCVLLNPAVFSKALSIAGGFGEAFLNGCLPVMLVWTGRYIYKWPYERSLLLGKWMLILLFLGSITAMILETIHLL